MFRKLVILVVVSLGSAATASVQPPIEERVAGTMLRMRLMGTLVNAYHLEHGSFPAADGQLRPVINAIRAMSRRLGANLQDTDAWGSPLLYRANDRAFELISLGADRRPSKDHSLRPLRRRTLAPITETTAEDDDLVLADGRFVQRPFGNRTPEFSTINAINRIFGAAASFAIDNNQYPGDAYAFAPVAELASELVPIYIDDLPTTDGWGRPLLYTRLGGTLMLASVGSDGQPDRTYYPDVPCGLWVLDDDISSAPGSDIVQICGRLIFRPVGIE